MAVNGQKLLPQGNRGGALAVSRPKVSLVKKEVKKDITSAPDTMLVIKTRVVEIEKILKGSVALDKKLQDEERKKREKQSRAKEEKELETKDEDDADKKVKKKKSNEKLSIPKPIGVQPGASDQSPTKNVVTSRSCCQATDLC